MLRPIFQSATHVEWSQFEGLAALRCTVGVAIPLVRSGRPPADLPPLRQTQPTLGATDALVETETDIMVDSINTVASLLSA